MFLKSNSICEMCQNAWVVAMFNAVQGCGFRSFYPKHSEKLLKKF